MNYLILYLGIGIGIATLNSILALFTGAADKGVAETLEGTDLQSWHDGLVILLLFISFILVTIGWPITLYTATKNLYQHVKNTKS